MYAGAGPCCLCCPPLLVPAAARLMLHSMHPHPTPAVVASLVYAVVGVFAAARYGLSTQGDVLVNQWLPGRWDGALDGLVAIYLSLSMVPMVMTMRFQLDRCVWFVQLHILFIRLCELVDLIY